MKCPACAADVPEDDAFCESCGQDLRTPAPPSAGSCACGAGPEEVDADGFCERCGRRVRRPPTDHIEQVVSPTFAAISDRGLRHDRNEDRCGIAAAGAGFALVVCDGVSATTKSERASEAVSAAMLQGLSAHLQRPVLDAGGAMREALAAAAATLNNPYQSEPDPPSTTMVAALVEAGVATIAWAGDSRVYWIDEGGVRQLTEDHSWMNDVVSARVMTVEDAEQDARAHAITRWFGADNAGTLGPEMARFVLPGAGTLLLCTDGLWNYAATPEALDAVWAQAQGGDALSVAEKLVAFANGCGGRDNVTVAVLRVGGLAPTERAGKEAAPGG